MPTMTQIVEFYVLMSTFLTTMMFFFWDRKVKVVFQDLMNVLLYVHWSMGVALVMYMCIVGTLLE